MTAALLAFVGSLAIGIGMLTAAFVVRIALLRAIRRHIPLRDVRLTLAPSGLALLAGAVGWLVSWSVDGDVFALLLGSSVSAGIFAAGVVMALRDDLRRLTRLLGGAVRPRASEPAAEIPL